MFRASPSRGHSRHEYRDAASQTLPMEVAYNPNNNNHSNSKSSVLSTASQATVIRGHPDQSRQRYDADDTGHNPRHRAYDNRRMTESLWSPPPLMNSASGTSPFNSSSTITVGKDGGHLWNRKSNGPPRGPSLETSSSFRERGNGGRRDTGTSNEGRTMSSVGGFLVARRDHV